ncbi:MAG: hypothetical protein ABJH98_03970 [Reichenbachiella sp.]|uniref:hypothetical protein n=1 Tax=Reichenbachiella sp. TaxID=2184521 RepID=UPI0032982A08
MRFLILFCFGIILLFVSNESFAQSSRESEVKPIPASSSQTFSNKKKKSKKAFNKNYDQGIKDYEKLMKANKKKYRKMAKGMEKPQYSDPTYFGHKKKPKKRPKGKRKFCDECGIVH